MKYKIASGDFPPLKDFQKFGASRGERKHLGVDLSSGKRIECLAYSDGTCSAKKAGGIAGYYLTFNWSDGTTGLYSHIDKATFDNWKVGKRVASGQVIGYTGYRVGNSTGHVLHYQHGKYGGWVDPIDYIISETEMTKAEGFIQYKQDQDIPIYSNSDIVVKRVKPPKSGTFYATKNGINDGTGDTLMYSTSQKLDRWVHNKYIQSAYYGTAIGVDNTEAVRHIEQAQSELDTATNILSNK